MSRINHKRGRKSNYTKNFVFTTNHSLAKQRALQRDENCVICNSTSNLELHHISYHIKGKELENDNLKWCIIICGECHQKVHDDTFHIYNPKNPLRKCKN